MAKTLVKYENWLLVVCSTYRLGGLNTVLEKWFMRSDRLDKPFFCERKIFFVSKIICY